MGLFSQKKGNEKEQQACKWLKKQKIKILEQNYRCKGGEIDIIGLDKEKTLIFFEVKYRKTATHGHALEYISKAKQTKIILCAEFYLLNHPKQQHAAMRFDGLTFQADQQEPNWLKDIFWA
jgi:putative endonuclease